MLSVYGARACFYAFQPVFLASRFTATDVGALTCMQRLLGILVNPFVAGYADIYRKHRFVMLISALAMAILQVSLLLPKLGFKGVTLVLLVHSLFANHILNI